MHKSVRTRALQCPNSGICDALQQITYMGLCHAQQTKIRHNCCNPDPAKCRGPQKKPTLFCPVLSFPLHTETWEHVLCLWPTLCSLTHHPGLSLNKGSPGGGSPFTRARHCWGRHIGIKQFPKIFKVFGHKNMGTRAVSVAYTLQPDPPPWTLPEQGISRGWEPIHKGQALLG